MKRTYTSVILAGAMALGLAACSSTGTGSSSMGSSATSGTTSSTTDTSTGVQAGVPGTAGQLDNAPLSNGNANR